MSENLGSEEARTGARMLELPWAVTRRLEFVDYRLSWESQINRSDLTRFFGISIQQASLDLAEYLKLAPGNLAYDASTKMYRATNTFKAIFPSSSQARYLEDLLQTQFMPDMPVRSFLGWSPMLAIVPRPARKLNDGIVIEIVGAIRRHFSIRIVYQSLSSPEPTARSVSPHALVHDGFRWHMRAYCHCKNAFRDFNLSRIVATEGVKEDQNRREVDHGWNTFVRLELSAHPKLSASHRRLIELDYGMENGACVLECRQALLFYVLQQLGLYDGGGEKSPASQQIVLKNRKEILPIISKEFEVKRG